MVGKPLFSAKERSVVLMKLQRIVFVLAMVISMLSARVYSQTGKYAKSASTPESVNAVLGRWDLTLKAPDREYPSWLELRQEGGQLKAQMVSRWGNARPLSKVALSKGRLTFVSPKEEEERPDDMSSKEPSSGRCCRGPRLGQTEPPGSGPARERQL